MLAITPDTQSHHLPITPRPLARPQLHPQLLILLIHGSQLGNQLLIAHESLSQLVLVAARFGVLLLALQAVG